MHHQFESTVDAFEVDADRLAVKLTTKPGHYWVSAHKVELVATLRKSLMRGVRVELTVNVDSSEIADVIEV